MTAALADLAWLQELYELSQMTASDRDADANLLEMVRHVAHGFSAGSATLATYSEDGPCLRIVAATHLPPDALGTRIALGEGIFGSVARDGKPLLISGMLAASTPAAREAGSRSTATPVPDRRPPPHSSMVWPLQLKNRLVAVLAVNRQAHHEPFTERDLQRGSIMGSLLALVIENSRMHGEQLARIAALSELNADLAAVNDRLGHAQDQLRQSEKMASLGQLAAGVAHEINNPIGYVYSNLGTLEGYVGRLIDRVRAGGRGAGGGPARVDGSSAGPGDDSELAYLLEDMPQLMSETREGLVRVTRIVQDLKDFSRVDTADQWELADLNAGIRSTLNIVNNEIRYKVTVQLDLGELPLVECLPSQINQVVLNLLVNASHAVEKDGLLRVRSGVVDGWAWFEVEDDGCGIEPEVQARIFEPFFTTKPVGKGTGLGLSLSYSIVQKHRGRIELTSRPGVGSTFRVVIPVAQSVVSEERRHAHA